MYGIGSSLGPLTLKQPFPKGMHIYAHSYYISCSHVGLSSDLKKSTVVDEILPVCKSNVLLWEYFQLFYEKSKEWEIYTRTLVDAYMYIYCYCMNLRVMNLRVSVYLLLQMIIFTMMVHSSGLHTWCFFAILIVWCWVY